MILTGLWDSSTSEHRVQALTLDPIGFLAAPPPRMPWERPIARRGASLTASVVLHSAAAFVVALLVSVTASRPAASQQIARPLIAPRIVFLLQRGPGGGGGGGGRRQLTSPARAQTPGRDHVTLPVAQPVVSAPKPEDVPRPAQQVLLDAVPLASGSFAQIGIPTAPALDAISQGFGLDGGAGDGQGTGIGSGHGPGWDRGSGGGTGGGVYRPGSGVTSPVLLSSVKPQYTPAALRDRIQGFVELDVVVRSDGSVGTVRVVRSLDARGLDAEAIAAVRRWRFRPGRLGGVPVDVLVTAIVDFSIR